MNMYAYVGGDPVNATDASGMCASCPVDELIDYQKVALENQQNGNRFATHAWQWLKENHPVGAPARGYDAVMNQDWESAVWSVGAFGLGAIADRVGHGVALIRGALRQACCFAAGTLVSTRDGLRPIEDIRVGDLVLARNEKTGETGLKPVTELVRRHDREIWKLTLATSVDGDGKGTSDTFETTDDHPWRTAAGTWVQTIDLKPGIRVLRARGPPLTVVSVERTGVVRATFNLEVADWHTYFVGDAGAWVHNSGCGGIANSKRGDVLVGQDDAEFSVLNPGRLTDNAALRKDWESVTGKSWPVDPASGKPMDLSHEVPLADGGPDHVSNVRPRSNQDHRMRHGSDWRRWGERRRRNPK
jgi:hypothetical protein